jgi:hypothetical protein
MIRIQNNGGSVHNTKITDIETGADIKYVKRIELVLDGDMKGPPEVRMQLVKYEVDCVAEIKEEEVVVVGPAQEAAKQLQDRSQAAEWGAVIGCFLLFMQEKNFRLYHHGVGAYLTPIQASSLSELRQQFIESVFKK